MTSQTWPTTFPRPGCTLWSLSPKAAIAFCRFDAGKKILSRRYNCALLALQSIGEYTDSSALNYLASTLFVLFQATADQCVRVFRRSHLNIPSERSTSFTQGIQYTFWLGIFSLQTLMKQRGGVFGRIDILEQLKYLVVFRNGCEDQPWTVQTPSPSKVSSSLFSCPVRLGGQTSFIDFID